MSGMGMSGTSSSSASIPPTAELESPAPSSSAGSGSASFPSFVFIADLNPSSGAKLSYLSQPIQAPYCSMNPPPHRRPSCVNHFICLSRTGPWPWCLSRAVFCAVTLAVDCAIAIWEGRERKNRQVCSSPFSCMRLWPYFFGGLWWCRTSEGVDFPLYQFLWKNGRGGLAVE